MSTQSVGECVDVDVAEAVISEALIVGDERVAAEAASSGAAEERARAAELLARHLCLDMEIQPSLLEHAEKRGAERERLARESAQRSLRLTSKG